MSLIRSQYPVLFDHAGICAADPIFHGDVAGKRQEAFDSQRDIVTGDSKMKLVRGAFGCQKGRREGLSPMGSCVKVIGVCIWAGWLKLRNACACLAGKVVTWAGLG